MKRSDITLMFKLIKEYKRDKRIKSEHIKSGQDRARIHNKLIGRPRKWDDTNFKLAVYEAEHDKDGNSIRYYAKQNNVPYHSLWYRVTKDSNH